VLASCQSAGDISIRPELPKGNDIGFNGLIVAASDLDTQYSVYANGVLDQIPGAQDTMSLLKPGPTSAPVIGTSEASHSVVGWPQIVDVSPNGQYLYTVETRGKPVPDLEKVDDIFTGLPEGSVLTVTDISDPSVPSIVSKTEVGTDLNSVMVSPDGNSLIIATTDDLVIVDLDDGEVTDVHSFPIAKAGTESERPGIRAAAVHPDSSHVAVNLDDRIVRFYRIDRAEGQPPELTAVGEDLRIGETLSAGAFHPSGDYFLIPDVSWGNNSGAADFLFNDAGSLFAVKFDPGGAHSIASETKVGLSPEGFAISPDGTRIVTVNMYRTYLHDAFATSWVRGKKYASLSLLSFDASTGQATVLDEQRFEGNLPEDAVFDADGDALAVAIFEVKRLDDDMGYVGFWKIENDKLINTGLATPVARGVHDLVLVP
ncbi:MAG: hypothetical protein AAGJ51_05670, partial [Pseudomonadota bacterium]